MTPSNSRFDPPSRLRYAVAYCEVTARHLTIDWFDAGV